MKIIVGGVLEKDGKFLLVQEAKKEVLHKWNLPAGHLDVNETIFEGALREIFEETGLEVELTGIAQIANRKLTNDIFLCVIFSAKILKENISFNKNEILDVQWFSYEEIMNMNNELRDYELITNCIMNYAQNKMVPLDIIKIV